MKLEKFEIQIGETQKFWQAFALSDYEDSESKKGFKNFSITKLFSRKYVALVSLMECTKYGNLEFFEIK